MTWARSRIWWASAVVQAEDDVAAALGDQQVIAAAIDAQTAQATEDYRHALETLEAARAAFWATKRSRTWALRFPTERRPFSPGSPPRLARLAHLSANGEPFDPAVVLTELASEVTPPEPVKPHHWEPYRDVETSPSGHVLTGLGWVAPGGGRLRARRCRAHSRREHRRGAGAHRRRGRRLMPGRMNDAIRDAAGRSPKREDQGQVETQPKRRISADAGAGGPGSVPVTGTTDADMNRVIRGQA